MADASAFWSGAVTTAFGVVLGFSLTGVREILKSQRERRGHWLALRADIIRAGTLAAGYIDGKVLVPTTRLPMRAYHDSFPALLMAELLAEEEIEKLSRFFDNADSFNRSLNYAQDALGEDEHLLRRETERARLKATKLERGREGKATQYDEALAVVNFHLHRRTGHRLLWWKTTARANERAPSASN